MAAVERPLATGDAEVALASSPFRWRRFLSDEEVDAIHDVGREAMEAGGAVEDRSAWGQPAGTWRVAYLNEGGVFERRLPQLYSKIRAAAQRVAAEQGWGVLSATSAPVNFRCVEYHVMREGGGLLSRRHRTKGSLVRNISVLTDFLSSEAPRRGLAANHRPHAGRRGRSMTLPLPTPGLCAARCRSNAHGNRSVQKRWLSKAPSHSGATFSRVALLQVCAEGSSTLWAQTGWRRTPSREATRHSSSRKRCTRSRGSTPGRGACSSSSCGRAARTTRPSRRPLAERTLRAAALHGAAPVNRRPRATSLTAGRATGGRTCSPQIRSRRRGRGGRGTATRAACRRPPPLSLTTSRSRRGSKRATTRAREV